MRAAQPRVWMPAFAGMTGMGAHEGHPYIKQGCEVPASAGTTEAYAAWFDRLTMSGHQHAREMPRLRSA